MPGDVRNAPLCRKLARLIEHCQSNVDFTAIRSLRRAPKSRISREP